jgi:hypothetical protein
MPFTSAWASRASTSRLRQASAFAVSAGSRFFTVSAYSISRSVASGRRSKSTSSIRSLQFRLDLL